MDLFSENYLVHHGIKGQKWGIRRYQNLDRTLTELGKIHDREANAAKRSNNTDPDTSGTAKSTNRSTRTNDAKATTSKTGSSGSTSSLSVKDRLKSLATKENAKRVAVGAAVAAGTALAVYSAMHYPEMASTAKGVIRSGASSAQKALSSTASATKGASKALKDIADLSSTIQNEIKPQPKKTLKEEAIDEVTGKVTDKVSEKSKTAGFAVNTIMTNVTSKKNDGTSGLTLDPQETFDSTKTDQLMSRLDQISTAATISSQVLDTVGSGSEDLANDLLKKLGNARLN